MLQHVKLPPFQNVVASGIATLAIPAGPTYENLQLVLGGTFTKAMITSIVIKANGRIVWGPITGSRLDSILSYRGQVSTATILEIPFTELKARDRFGELLGAYASALGLNLTMEVTIAGATSPTLDCYALQSGPRAAGDPSAAAICKLINYPLSFASGGKQYVALHAGNGGGLLLKRLYFFHSNMTALEVRQNGVVIEEAVDAVNQHMQKQNGKTPQSGLWVWDTCLDWNIDEAIAPVSLQKLELYPTISAADTIQLYAEFVDPVGNV